jgi:hypothetical protein
VGIITIPPSTINPATSPFLIPRSLSITGYLGGWLYRKVGSLSRASGAVTNYQMKLLLGESGDTAGADVHCEGLCKPDFSDIRFTQTDGITLLDYSIESIAGATPNQLATVWVEHNSIGVGATPVPLYYGNAAAAAVSNGKNTFPFFDHFLDDPPAAADWFHWIDNGSETVSNSIFTITGHASYNAWGCKQKFGTNYAFRGRVRSNDNFGTDINIFAIDDRSDDGTYVGAGTDQASVRYQNGPYWITSREGNVTNTVRSETIMDYAIVEIQRNASIDVRFLIDNSLKATVNTNVPTDTCGILIYSNTASTICSADWVLVRQFLATEPVWGAWGAQEAY